MRSVIVLIPLLSYALLAQPTTTVPRDPRWQTVGAGPLASMPAQCTANRDVYICNGSGCATNGAYYYCTATNTWTMASGGGGGSTPSCATYTVPYTSSAFVAASTSTDALIFILPARGKITGVTIKHSAQFSDGAGAMTDVSVSLGDGTSHTAYSGSAQSIGEATPVSDTAFLDAVLFKSTTMAASSVVAHFTATGRNFGDGASTYLTGGSVDISVCWVVLP